VLNPRQPRDGPKGRLWRASRRSVLGATAPARGSQTSFADCQSVAEHSLH